MEACRECVEQRSALAAEFEPLGALFAALGEGNRQRVLLALLTCRQVGLRTEELAERTHLSRPAVSRHLRLLREVGAVAVYRRGTRNYYYPNAAADCWRRLRTLAGHICDVVDSAAEEGYPHFEEEAF